ncbi:succinyl-diaminopimelate desuccinylase [Hydrogenophilus thermoluteolus]|nr:succinyl-diaminopimelate desuccinylase [Hydrogenophilus thermoluteolus]GLW61476.1 succinyl-diaminopimelate desuccinylase [Hydrogenophilus thermoluteolus]
MLDAQNGDSVMMSPVLELAQALIARPSVTPDDAGCLDLIANRLTSLGFSCERFDCAGVANLWARRGTTQPYVVFAGHTDVVPPGDSARWRFPPFTPTVAEGDDGVVYLYGRGAADMKSSLAAMVVAASRFVASHPNHRGSIAFLLTSDEEGPAQYGTRHVVDLLAQRGETLDYTIVGEPTCSQRLGDTLKNGRRGSLTGHLTVLGKQGHVAYPHLADNPVHRLAPALAELCSTVWDHGNDDFPPTTFQVAHIHAGTGATNVIPGTCTVDFNFRFSTEQTPEQLIARTEAILNRHHLRYTLDWSLSGRPFLTPRAELVAALHHAITAVTGVTPTCSTSGGTSDGRFIAQICPQVVEFGPVNATIHQVDERIAVADLEPLARIYETTLHKLLAREDGV